jgi:addiction module HigA family antidote
MVLRTSKLSVILKEIQIRKLKPVIPGEPLLEEFLKPLGIRQYRLAKEIGVPAPRIGQIIKGKRIITADTDLRLCRFLAFQTVTGCAHRLRMIRRLPSGRWAQKSSKSSHGLHKILNSAKLGL